MDRRLDGARRHVGLTVEHDPVDAVRLTGRQHGELCGLGAQHATGLRQHIGDDLLGVTRATDRLGELVQELQARVPLAERRVLAIGGTQHDSNDDQ